MGVQSDGRASAVRQTHPRQTDRVRAEINISVNCGLSILNKYFLLSQKFVKIEQIQLRLSVG